jgi:hypothetical protein
MGNPRKSEGEMKRIFLGLGAALSLMLLPGTLQAQVPVVLICEDGTTQPGSSRVACGDHGGMDWEATRAWSEMRAGHYAAADTVVCIDGQARAAARNACKDHGGVDSASTVAAVKRRAQARRFADRPPQAEERTTSQGGTAGAAGTQQDTASARTPRTGEDSLKWGYPENRNPEVQNPPGYRGMERAIDAFPADTTPESSGDAPEDATTRVQQMQRQDSIETAPHQNPPGYRGMERPGQLDSISSQPDTQKGARADSAATTPATADPGATDSVTVDR